jgi:hypothetical protein
LNNTSTTVPTSGGQSNVVTTTTTLQQIPPQTDCEVVPQLQFPGTISMANNLTTTKDSQVKLNIFRDEASSMKISYNDTCTCGTWEPYATEKVINVANFNSINKVSVQFKDYDDSPSVCTSVSYIHDSSAPQLSLTRIPGSLILGSTISFTVQASDNLSGLDHFTCLLNDQPYNCSGLTINTQAGGLTTFNGQLDFPNLPVNVYVAKVIAYDKLGNSVEAKHPFEIVPAAYNISQDMIVKQNKNMVDILFVVDNSKSMLQYQQRLAAQTQNMVSTLNSLKMDYRVAVTTTTMSKDSVTYPMTRKIMGIPTYLTSSNINLLQDRIIVGESGSDLERGLDSMTLVTSKSYLSSIGSDFIRDDALLAVIFMSDERDQSSEFGDPNSSDFINLLNGRKPNFESGAKAWLVNYIGILTNQSCDILGGNVSIGTQFINLVTASRGVKSSICDVDLSLAVSNIKARIVSKVHPFTASSYIVRPPTTTLIVDLLGCLAKR